MVIGTGRMMIEEQKIDIHTLRNSAKLRGGECLGIVCNGPDTSVGWICGKKHEMWFASFRDIVGGYWCPTCAHTELEKKKHAGNGSDVSSEEFTPVMSAVRDVVQLRRGKCSLTRFEGLTSAANWQCAKGHEWQMSVWEVASGLWCAKCDSELPPLLDDGRTMSQIAENVRTMSQIAEDGQKKAEINDALRRLKIEAIKDTTVT